MAPVATTFPSRCSSTTPRSPDINVPHSSTSKSANRKPTKKQRVLDFAAAREWVRIGEHEWNELRASFPDVSETVLRESGLTIDAPWCGVRQHTFHELEDSLREFSQVYESRGDLRRLCRDQVIAAKDRARIVSIRGKVDDETRQRKAEMVEWMLVWLGDPAVFPAWAELRRAHTASLLV